MNMNDKRMTQTACNSRSRIECPFKWMATQKEFSCIKGENGQISNVSPFDYYRFTMKRKCLKASWTYSATRTWWILPWMFTEISIQTRKFHKVSKMGWCSAVLRENL